MTGAGPDNDLLAAHLREAADLLAVQGADGFRIAAYRRAADTLAGLDRSAADILVREGRDGLIALPAIGAGLAAAIAEMVATGRWSQLDRLKGAVPPEALFRTLPGVGPALARRLHDDLEVETLEGLEAAAHDGRLEALPGIGRRRADAIRAMLAQRLGRPRLRAADRALPPVALLLDVDREYREKATAGALPRIAPKRFNPQGEAWLPVLHTSRDGWQLTALFSNTARAHELGRTRDWVVLYFHAEGAPEGQCTVVTETRRGPLDGRRVVRGREAECARHYAGASVPPFQANAGQPAGRALDASDSGTPPPTDTAAARTVHIGAP